MADSSMLSSSWSTDDDSSAKAANEKICLGLIDCTGCVGWRGDGSSRTCWQLLCTVFLVTETFLFYFYPVRGNYWMIAVGALWLCKLLIEIWGQTTPTWVCPGGPITFAVVYLFGVPGLLYTYSFCTVEDDIVFNFKDILGFLLFFGGSAFSLYYEMHRFRWKQDEANRGRLHTTGLAQYCRHPNYFGDLFAYTGWGIVAGTTCIVSVPLFTVWSFVYFVIPNSDAYLASRYASEWPEYAEKTATLVPFLHSSIANQLLAWVCFFVSIKFMMNCTDQCMAWSM